MAEWKSWCCRWGESPSFCSGGRCSGAPASARAAAARSRAAWIRWAAASLLGGGGRFSLGIGGALKTSGARLVRGGLLLPSSGIGGLLLLGGCIGGSFGGGGRLFGVGRGGPSHGRGWSARSGGGCAGEVGAARREAGARALRGEVPAR